MCYIEDCEDHYQPPVDPAPDCPYEDCEGGSGNTGSESGNTGGSDGKKPSGNCCCDDRTDTGGTTTPGGGHICICNCDDCADGFCGVTRYYKPGDSFCLYSPVSTDYYAWSSEPSIVVVGPDGQAHVICEGSAYICLRSRTDPTFRRCWRVVATNNPPTSQGGSGTNPSGETNPGRTENNDDLCLLTEEEKKFVAVIAGEAGGEQPLAWECVAQVIMNRLNEKRDAWRYAENVTDIISDKSQFNAYGGKNYNLAMSYLNNRDGTNQKYENIILTVLPYYYQTINLSGLERVVLFFSPKSMGFVDSEKTIPRVPNYATSPLVEEVFLPGIDYDTFRFFRYK